MGPRLGPLEELGVKRRTEGPTRDEVAAHLDMNRARLTVLISRGDLPQSGSVDEYRVAYIRQLRGRAAGTGGGELAFERARLAREQGDKIARENALARGSIVDASDVESWLVRLFSAVAQRIRALPSKAAPEAHGAATIGQAEAVIRRIADEALEELADAKWIAPLRERSAPPSDEDRARSVPTAEAAHR